MNDPVAALREALLAGGVAVVPTDTVYGLAAARDVPAGVDALYRIKGRPRSQACQVLLFAPALLDAEIAALPEPLARGAGALLPGPATVIVPDPEGRHAAAAGAQAGSVGLRAPVPPAGLAALDVALVATSANHPGGPDPSRLGDVPADLRAASAHALDAGPLPGVASAVVDLRPVAEGGPARLIRPGADPGATRDALGSVGLGLV